MTCIVAIAEKGNIWMGADSAGVGGLFLQTRKDPKIYCVGDMLIGFTSSFRMGQVLAYQFNPPNHEKNISIEKYLATVFIDEIRKTYKIAGYAKKESEVESAGTFLLGYRGRIFKILDDYQVAESNQKFDSCGCGVEIALGSLYSTKDLNPKTRILTALKAAESFSAGVRAPFIVMQN